MTAAAVLCASASAAAVPQDDDWLAPAERTVLEGLRFPKRRADWRLGRWTAKRAVQALIAEGGSGSGSTAPLGAGSADPDWFVPPSCIAITAAEDGAPEAIVNGASSIRISISHSCGNAFAIASLDDVAIGCDLERIEPRSRGFVLDFFTSSECHAYEDASILHRPLLATLIWSGKESALKAMRAGLRMDTRDVDVSVALDDLAAEMAGWRMLRVREVVGTRRFEGWWRVVELPVGEGTAGKFVQTVVGDGAVELPRDIE